MPNYDPLVQYETEKLDDAPFRFKDDKMNKDDQKGRKGIRSPGYFSNFLKWVREDFHTNFREFKHLMRKSYSDVQYSLRQLKKSQTMSMSKAADLLAKNIDGLSKNEFDLLNTCAYMMDFYEQITKINPELIAAGKKDKVITEFPYGWTEAQIRVETPRVWAKVNANAKVLRAWNNRLDNWRILRTEYSQAMKDVGYDVDGRLKRAFYFRHQVLDILKTQGETTYSQKGSGGKLAVPTGRSFMKGRKGGTYEMNLNYIQAEFEVMSQMIHDTNIGRVLKEIMDKHGVEEKQDGYTEYNPREDTVFYLANSIPGKMAQEAMEQGLKELKVPVSKINQVVALGGKYKGYYLPDGVAKTLNDALLKPRRTPFLSGVRHGVRMWKMWQLLHPFRVLKYNGRNLTGDAEAMFVGDPATFRYVWGAGKDVWKWIRTGVLTKELRDYIGLGGQETTLQGQEMGGMLTLPAFIKYYDGKRPPPNPFSWYGRQARKWTDAREIILRYAAYKRYLELFDSGKKIKNYAASMPEEVNQLTNNKDKAFMMANDLLGAYDRISVFGESLRDGLAPFWSFQEINMKRTLQFARNAVKNDDLMAHIGRKLGAKGVVIPIKIGKFAFKLGMLHVAAQAWNMFVYPEEEDALPDEMHKRVHVIFGHNKDDIYYFPRIGILGDLLEWAGVDTAPADAWDVLFGKKTIKDVIDSYEYGTKNLLNVGNKIVQSLGPTFKIPVELLTGEKVFPSIWNRQPITDRLRYIAEQLQADAFYDVLTGRPTKESHWVDTMMKLSPVYKGDRKRFGWLSIQSKVYEYKKANGLSGTGFITTESGNALYNLGMAWRYGDQKAWNKYLGQYIRIKINTDIDYEIDVDKIMEEQWKKLDPLGRLPKKHRDIFEMQLFSSKKDTYTYGLAMQYYYEIQSGVQFSERNK